MKRFFITLKSGAIHELRVPTFKDAFEVSYLAYGEELCKLEEVRG